MRKNTHFSHAVAFAGWGVVVLLPSTPHRSRPTDVDGLGLRLMPI